MRNRFVQRGGWWVAGQFMLRLASAVLGIVCRDDFGDLRIGGPKALGRNLTPFPKPSVVAHLVQHGLYGSIRKLL